MGYVVEYRCLRCGQGTHQVAMSCTSALCLRCAKVHVDNWVSQVSQALHAGGISRHIILTVPAMFRTPFYQNAAVVFSAFMVCPCHRREGACPSKPFGKRLVTKPKHSCRL